MGIKNYSAVRDHIGVVAEAGRSDRYVRLIDKDIHVDNQVKCHNAWRHNVEDVLVVVVTIEQGGNLNTSAQNINAAYVIDKSGTQRTVHKIESGFSHGSSDELVTQMTKQEAIDAAENWMQNHPDGNV